MKMFLNQLSLLLCLVALSTGAAVSTNALIVTPPPVQIVTCGEDVNVDALLQEFHLVPKFKYPFINGFAAPMDAAMIGKLKADGRILFVEADGPVTLCATNYQYGVIRMGMSHFPPAHLNYTNEPLDVDVAILDTGIDPHEDLDLIPIERTFVTFGDDGRDALGHGTAVAGVVAARDNLVGVAGVAPGVRIWNVKVLGPPPDNNWTDILSGLNFIHEHSDEISVVNVSITNDGPGTPVNSLHLGILRLVNAGVVVVAAAGNLNQDIAGLDGAFGTGDDVYPASLTEVMAVSAMDPTIDDGTGLSRDTFWVETLGSLGSNFSQVERTNTPDPPAGGHGWTNYVFSPGGAIDVAAPGVNILSTAAGVGGDGVAHTYAYQTGTSYAAPHVTGLVALYIAVNGRATNAEGVYRIRQAIIDNALPQSQWHTNNTHDPDTNPEPLAIASENLVPLPVITKAAGAPGNFQVNFATVPGYDYTVQSASALTPPIAWTNLVTMSGSSNAALVSVTDTNELSQSFYQLSRNPSP